MAFPFDFQDPWFHGPSFFGSHFQFPFSDIGFHNQFPGYGPYPGLNHFASPMGINPFPNPFGSSFGHYPFQDPFNPYSSMPPFPMSSNYIPSNFY